VERPPPCPKRYLPRSYVTLRARVTATNNGKRPSVPESTSAGSVSITNLPCNRAVESSFRKFIIRSRGSLSSVSQTHDLTGDTYNLTEAMASKETSDGGEVKFLDGEVAYTKFYLPNIDSQQPPAHGPGSACSNHHTSRASPTARVMGRTEHNRCTDPQAPACLAFRQLKKNLELRTDTNSIQIEQRRNMVSSSGPEYKENHVRFRDNHYEQANMQPILKAFVTLPSKTLK
jgi:hypothetical protein